MANRPLRILNLLSAGGKGGADILALNISALLKERGHEVIFGCPSHCALLNQAKTAGLPIFMLDPAGRMDMKCLRPFMNFCRDKKIDIVNVHHSHGRHLLVASRFRGLKTKNVFTRHCISGSFPYVGAFFYNFATDMNIAVSDTVKQSLIRGGMHEKKVRTVYGAINVDRFAHVEPEKIKRLRELHSRPGAVTIGMVGRFEGIDNQNFDAPTGKRHEVLFRAVSKLGIDYVIIALGVWTHKAEEDLRMLASHCGLDPGKLVIGFHEDIAPFYKIMDINVMPSPAEGLSLAVMEGMAAGTVTIGAASGGIVEIITDGKDGVLFKPDDSVDLAVKMRTVLAHNTLREQLISSGQRKIRKMFSIERAAYETEKIFYEIV